MNNNSKNLMKRVIVLSLLFGLGSFNLSFSQDLQGADAISGPTLVNNVRIGPHPQFTRILVNLSKGISYRVKADFLEKKITLILKNAALGPKAHSRTFKDKNLEKVLLTEGAKKTVEITLFLKNQNSRFFHLLKSDPYQIVVDVKGETKPIIPTKTKEDKPDAGEVTLDEGEITLDEGEAKPKRVRIKGKTQADIEEAKGKQLQDQLLNGGFDYQAALKIYQQRTEGSYLQALILFAEFRKKYPKSRFLGNIAYLTADAEFRIADIFPVPIYEKALTAYQFALREYPDSKFSDHALAKLAFIYDEMNLILEAKSLYEEGLKRKGPKEVGRRKKGRKTGAWQPTRFASFLKTRLALLLLKENRFEEAYITLLDILKRSPRFPNKLVSKEHKDARNGIFQIAKWYYDQENFSRALEIYKISTQRWPDYLDDHAAINFFMGEMYYENRNFAKARKHYFDLINLAPETKDSSVALNRIGDTYFLEGNDMASLAVFEESAKRTTEKREAQYGKIRLADIGIRNPNLPVSDIFYDVEPYFHPLKAYEEVLKEAVDDVITAEALLSRGTAFLRGQQYLDSMQEFKKLLAMNPEPRIATEGERLLRQALIFLVDKFSRQQGSLPVLYVYADYLGLSLGDIHNIKTVLQIGESYQNIGMFQEAVNHYERVKKLDSRKTYSDRLFLNLGRIHLERGEFKDAARTAEAFLNKFSRSDLVPGAMKLLAEALAGQEQYEKALEAYNDLLARGVENPSEIHYRTGQIHSQLNQLPDAVQAFQRTIDSFDRNIKPAPEHVQNAYYMHGIALYNNNEFFKANESLNRAKQLFPDHSFKAWAGYLLAEGYFQLQEKKQAKAALTELAKSKDADDLIRRAAQSKLKILGWEKQFKELL